MMNTKLEKKIKNYRILACMSVRATGSTHGHHPHRCLWDICGKPMIQWALEPVMQCEYIDKIVVCTEDRKIRDIVERLGIMVIDRPLFQARVHPRDYSRGLFKRFNPRSITSQAPSIYTEVPDYVLYWLEEEQDGWTPDIYIDFVANQPMGTVEILNRVIETFFEDEEATEIRTFFPLPGNVCMVNPTTGRLMSLFGMAHDRQLHPKLFSFGPYHLFGHPLKVSSGGISIAAVYIEPEEGSDVHTEEDLFLTKCYMKRRLDRQKKQENKKEREEKK